MQAKGHESVDPAIDLYAAVVRKAIDDVKRGPGCHVRRRREYESARAFLERLGLLPYVQQRDPEAEVVFDDVM